MNKYFLLDGIEVCKSFLLNQYGYLSYVKTRMKCSQEILENISENKKYSNIHKGKRCFIIGNGPSLRQQDLSCLKGEIIFTVNQAGRNPNIRNLCPKYHFWIDPVFFNLDSSKSEDMEILETYKMIYTENNRPITFLPQHAVEFVKKCGLDKEIDIQYFIQRVVVGKKYKKNFDFTKSIPSFGTVIQSCIAMALYMGFSEIYLLGCDTTGIITIISGALDASNAQYSYEISENEKKRMHEKYSNEEFMKTSIIGFVDLLDTYKKLYVYAIKRGVILANCSAQTVIQSIPRKQLETLFSE